MKRIAFFSCFMIHLICSAQKTKPTSQSSAKQAQAEMEKELKELEKDDPEMAKQVREMMKQKPLTKSIVQEPPVPKFVSPISTVPVKQPVLPPTPAQSKQNLLYYKGKKINDSVLIMSNGSRVLYSRKRNRIIVQPDPKNKSIDKLLKELARNEQRKNEFLITMEGMQNSFFLFPIIEQTLERFDEVHNRFSESLKNTIELPVINIKADNAGKSNHRSGGYAYNRRFFYDGEFPVLLKELRDEMKFMMKNMPEISVPIPPQRNYDTCFACSEVQMKAHYDQLADSWNKAFFGKEEELNMKGLVLLHTIERYKTFKFLDADSVARLEDEVFKVKEFVIKRMEEKVEMLLEQFGNDFSVMDPVIQAVLSFKRQKMLIGMAEDMDAEITMRLKNSLQSGRHFLEQQIREKNYHIVFFSLDHIFALERQKALLGEEEEDNGSAALEIKNQIDAFNRFNLKMEMEFDLAFLDDEGKETLTANGTLSTNEDVFVSLGRLGCKYQFYLTKTDYRKAKNEKEFWIPLKIQGGTKKVKIDERWETYQYDKPKEAMTVFMPIRILLCKDKFSSQNKVYDSLYVQILRYVTDDLKPYAEKVANGYSIDFMGYANNMFVTPSQLEQATDEMQDIAMEWMKAITEHESGVAAGGGPGQRLKRDYEITEKQQQYQFKLADMAMLPKALILFNARNGYSNIVNAEVNTAHSEGQLVLKKGNIKLNIEHDPLPYTSSQVKKPLKKS